MLALIFFIISMLLFIGLGIGIHASFSLLAWGLAFLAAGLVMEHALPYWTSRRQP